MYSSRRKRSRSQRRSDSILTKFLNLEGQKVTFNEEAKTLFFTIGEPFYSAGRILDWPQRGIERENWGIGLNGSIVKFIQLYKSHLVVRVADENQSCWIYYDTLKDFMLNNMCEYTIKGKTLKIIPWNKFITVAEHVQL